MKKVEEELTQLSKKYSFLKMPNVDYEEIVKKLSFKEFKAENKIEIEDNWGEFEDDDKEEHDGDIETFFKWCYEDYLESKIFDE